MVTVANTLAVEVGRWLDNELGLTAVSVTRLVQGRNASVFRVDHAGGRLAVKVYPVLADDPRDRLYHEWSALSFLAKHGVSGVPRPVAQNNAKRFAAYSWMAGKGIASPPDDKLVEEGGLVDFLGRLHDLRKEEGAAELPEAVDAGVIPLAPEARIGAHVAALRHAAALDAPWSNSLERFLSRFETAAERVVGGAREACARLGFRPEEPLSSAQLTLSPSDFGVHNMLRGDDGGVVVLDFEYFGWDDPVKLVSDTLLHPGSTFTTKQGGRLKSDLCSLYGADDPAFEYRLAALMPLYKALWCLILLNEFLGSGWRRRRAAGLEAEDREALLCKQLNKAFHMLATLERD